MSAPIDLPPLYEIAPDLVKTSRLRRLFSLLLPFFWFLMYFLFAFLGWWPVAALCLICLSFISYGSVSHDLVHGNLGLGRRTNDFLLSLIELLCLRSGHAYRMAHLHHHARFPHTDDIEGAAARMSLVRVLWEGIIFQPKIWLWAVTRPTKERILILAEGIGCLALIALSVLMIPVTHVFMVYVVLMILGSWIIPLVTVYIPHDAEGESALAQTRAFRGRVASLIALEHLYHLEHHLYPSVPHHHWPELARRLDPYLEEAGVKARTFWF